jgi:enoyl-CoA hydratase/carnithine racemase
MIKSSINIGMQMPAGAAFDYEARCFEYLSRSEDWVEGRRAFLEKRAAAYIGK